PSGKIAPLLFLGPLLVPVERGPCPVDFPTGTLPGKRTETIRSEFLRRPPTSRRRRRQKGAHRRTPPATDRDVEEERKNVVVWRRQRRRSTRRVGHREIFFVAGKRGRRGRWRDNDFYRRRR